MPTIVLQTRLLFGPGESSDHIVKTLLEAPLFEDFDGFYPHESYFNRVAPRVRREEEYREEEDHRTALPHSSRPEPHHAGADLRDHGHWIGRDPRGLRSYIRRQAALNGIDPDVAVRVAEHEGLYKFLGDHGKSGGAFQLYTAGRLELF